MNKELPKAYNPKEYEDRIYKEWGKSGFFNPDNLDLAKNAPSYTIILPPPNITDKLHLGHSSMLAIEDLLIRYHRMKGYRALWLPGTDHAAIATQNVVEKKLLQEERKTRHDLGREKFLEKVWEFVKITQSIILHQTRKMGASLDWSREAFTLDKPREKAVKKMFVDMYEAGVIYRGERIVNWCPRCHSTLADDEVEYKDQKAKLYTFKYSANFPFTIATTRPETKLGDTAVAVNPKDKRYKKYIGKIYEVDFCDTKLKLKIIADQHVEMDFGTGALGVTPAHSMADWQMAEKNDLKIIKVISEDGKINNNFQEYSGKTVEKARAMIVKKLRKNNLLEKEEEIENNLSVCYRCNTPIEPLLSKQWFVNVDKKLKRLGGKSLKEKAIEAAKNKEIKFIPERFEKRYLDWMENLHDWCISRQIWFGHRAPVFYDINDLHNKDGEIYFKQGILKVSEYQWEQMGAKLRGRAIRTANQDIRFTNFDVVSYWIRMKWFSWEKINVAIKSVFTGKCNKYRIIKERKNIKDSEIQDPDSLDTWFSSGMWTFSTLGWPSSAKAMDGKPRKTGDLKKFHPTQVLETGYEILTLWVSRMIMMSLFALQEIPFENVYLHGMVLDKHGKKMSKSAGNGIDPIDVINKFGTDAVRLSLLIGNTPGNDVRISEEKIAGYRNLVNKLWNISRYILQNQESRIKNQGIDYKNLTLSDKWILNELNDLISFTKKLEQFHFSVVGEELYDFTWNKFADWYLETSKIEKNKDEILFYILRRLLILWHPFIPFVTEKIWKNLDSKNLLMIEKWPEISKKYFHDIEDDFVIIRDIVKSIRNARSENKIEPARKIKAVIYGGESIDLIKSQEHLIKNLWTGIKELDVKKKGEKIKGAIYIAVSGVEIYLIGAVDKDKEKIRIKKEIENLEQLIIMTEKKLSNKRFIERAPEKIVEQEKEKLKLWRGELKKLKEQPIS